MNHNAFSSQTGNHVTSESLHDGKLKQELVSGTNICLAILKNLLVEMFLQNHNSPAIYKAAAALMR